jgi:Icc-related predicted phosphoesterase
MAQLPNSNPVQQSAFRVAAVGDLHCTKASAGAFAPWLESVNTRADVLLLCGDLTDYGTPEEAQVLLKELSVVRVPVLAVLGNHDYESSQRDEVVHALCAGGVKLLAGESSVVGEIGFVGTKGYMGGFGSYTLGFWGEPTTKRFAQEALDESLLLEGGLARLRTKRRVAVLHYSPIQATIEGEPVPIHFPSIRSSVAVAWKSLCCATLWTPCSTATRIAARWRGARATAYRCTTWPCRC